MRKFLPTLLLIILAIIWGSSFILMKEGLKALSPVQMASLRLIFSGLVFLPFAIYHMTKIARADLKWAALAGLIGNGIPAFLFALAQTRVSSSIAGALNSTTPVFTILIAFLFTKMVLTKFKIIGVLVGLVGALMLILLKADGKFEADFGYALLVVTATLFYGANINLIKVKLAKYKALYIASLPLFFVSIPGFLIFTKADGFAVMNDLNGQNLNSVVAVAILAVFGTALGLVLFNKLIQLTNPVFSSSVTYLIPVVAMFIGVLDGEQISYFQVIGLTLIITGIYLINKKTTPVLKT